MIASLYYLSLKEYRYFIYKTLSDICRVLPLVLSQAATHGEHTRTLHCNKNADNPGSSPDGRLLLIILHVVNSTSVSRIIVI